MFVVHVFLVVLIQIKTWRNKESAAAQVLISNHEESLPSINFAFLTLSYFLFGHFLLI